jgi:chromosome segregation ATPase
VNPIQKVMSLLTQLEQKTIQDGQVEQKAFEGYVSWCKTGAQEKGFAITTANSEIENLDATIGQAASDIETLDSKVQDLATSISSNDADLKAATGIRDKEHAEFIGTEKELVDAVDTLERAINVLQRKMRGSAMLQEQVSKKDIKQIVHALSAIVDAAGLGLHDKQTLLGLVQNNEDADEDDDSYGAPAPDAYKSHGGSIVDVLEDLKQKAVEELEQMRREEQNARHSFEMTKQSLEDGIKVDQKDLSTSKSLKHSAEETKANAQGELDNTKRELADSQHVLKNMKGECMTAATDHEASTRDRAEELKAIGAAKKILTEMAGGAQQQAYGDAASSSSFLQIEDVSSGLHTRADLANFEVVNLVRKLARKMKSSALAQLAGRITAVMKDGGEDPFAKVKQLIGDMIVKLEQDAGSEAKHKAYCDKEMAETKQKLGELRYDLEKVSSKIDKARSTASQLKEEVAGLSQEIAEISKAQAGYDEYRREENAAYKQTKADLTQGLQGVRQALQVLRDYYANEADDAASAAALIEQPAMPTTHSKSSGAGNSIIGMLEVVESDLGKALASTEMEEETAAVAYERSSMENRVSKSMKEKDVEYKTKSAVSNDKAAVELSSDRDSLQTELDAVLEYSANIRGMCEVKPESYEDRKGRRETEIAGLREALTVLEGEAVLLQGKTKKMGAVGAGSGHLRGANA